MTPTIPLMSLNESMIMRKALAVTAFSVIIVGVVGANTRRCDLGRPTHSLAVNNHKGENHEDQEH